MMLDVRTISLSSCVANTAMAIAMTYIWSRRRTYHGFGAWTLSAWFGAAGIGLVVARGMLPDFITILVANALFFGSALLIVQGLGGFTGEGHTSPLRYVLPALSWALLAVFVYAHPSLQIRLLLISFTIGGLCLQGARLIRRRMPLVLPDANPLIFPTLLAVAVLFLIRGVLAMIAPPASEDFAAPSVIQAFSLLLFLGAQLLVSAGLIVLNAERVEYDRQLAVDECKILRGIIPICASCKKVRDDKGAWNQLEVYIRQHSEAEFSHGVCPDCAHTMFGRE